MTKNRRFGKTQNVAITMLVDNRADLIVKSTDTVKRFTDEPLLAEHGLSVLINLQDAGIKILWDAGISETALLENARRMEVDLTQIDKIALSHGHGDHTAAMTQVLRQICTPPETRRWESDVEIEEILVGIKQSRVPLILHPAALRERWGIRKDGTRFGPGQPPPYKEWEAIGAEVVLSSEPYQLGPGCWTTGYVPRQSFEQAGIPKTLFYRKETDFIQDYIDEDQAIVIHVAGKGLVVVSGCAHSGIVNTVRHAQEISGVERVWAILGGFHMAFTDEEDTQRTIDAIKALDPVLVAPSHCTGERSSQILAEAFGDGYVASGLGTRIPLL